MEELEKQLQQSQPPKQQKQQQQKDDDAGDNKEMKWIDAWVRWPRSTNTEEDGEEEEEEEDDDDSEESNEETNKKQNEKVFTVSFRRKKAKEKKDDEKSSSSASSASTDTNNNNTIDISLCGYPMDCEQIWNSTGLTIWDSAYTLCDYLIENLVQDLPNPRRVSKRHPRRRILEIGSGLGLCGILTYNLLSSEDNDDDDDDGDVDVAAKTDLVLTDGDTDTLQQLRYNVSKNISSSSSSDFVNLSIHQLLWGTKYTKQYIESQQQQRQYGRDGEEEEDDRYKFDLIFGSDLIYVPSNIQPMFETIQLLLKRDGGGIFLFTYCSRRNGGSTTIEMILNIAVEMGFKYTLLIHKGSNDEASGGEVERKDVDSDILLYKFEWK